MSSVSKSRRSTHSVMCNCGFSPLTITTNHFTFIVPTKEAKGKRGAELLKKLKDSITVEDIAFISSRGVEITSR